MGGKEIPNVEVGKIRNPNYIEENEDQYEYEYFCMKCDGSLDDEGWTYCPHCGEPLIYP